MRFRGLDERPGCELGLLLRGAVAYKRVVCGPGEFGGDGVVGFVCEGAGCEVVAHCLGVNGAGYCYVFEIWCECLR